MSEYLLPAALVIAAVLYAAWRESQSGNTRDAALMAALAGVGTVLTGGAAVVA